MRQDARTAMVDDAPLQGELQIQIMQTVWRTGSGTVEEIRAALPARYRGAYNTVQTVLNRLSDRGLLTRRKNGRTVTYEATMDEAGYLSQSLKHTLAGASREAQNAALAALLGGMGPDERSELQRRAKRLADARRKAP